MASARNRTDIITLAGVGLAAPTQFLFRPPALAHFRRHRSFRLLLILFPLLPASMMIAHRRSQHFQKLFLQLHSAEKPPAPPRVPNARFVRFLVVLTGTCNTLRGARHPIITYADIAKRTGLR